MIRYVMKSPPGKSKCRSTTLALSLVVTTKFSGFPSMSCSLLKTDRCDNRKGISREQGAQRRLCVWHSVHRSSGNLRGSGEPRGLALSAQLTEDHCDQVITGLGEIVASNLMRQFQQLAYALFSLSRSIHSFLRSGCVRRFWRAADRCAIVGRRHVATRYSQFGQPSVQPHATLFA